MFAAIIGGLLVLLAIAAIALAIVKKAAAWLLIAVVLLFLGGATFKENPWWVLLSIALAGLGLLLVGLSKEYGAGVIAGTVALVLYLQGRFNLFSFVAHLPVLVYVGIGLAVTAVILLVRRVQASGIGILVVAIIVTILGIAGVGGGAQAAATTNTPSDEMIDAITIKETGYTCATDTNGLIAPMTIKALEPLVGQGGSRLYADAESTPFTATTPAGMLDERKAENCINPHLGSEAANFFANLKLGDVAVLDLNPWLKPFAGNPRDVVDEKADYYTLTEAEKAKMRSEGTPDQEAIDRNIEWKAVAEKLNTLIQAFKLDVEGAKQEQSYLNYHLVAGGLVADIPPVELNPQQENRKAILLYLIEKDGTCLAKMGYNVEDKRTEQFVCAPPPKPTTPGSPGSTTPGQPGCTEPCGTTTTPPGCEKPCGTTTTTPPRVCPPEQPYGTWPVCKDKETNDPGANGNANEGGQNEDQGSGASQPHTTNPSVPYNPPPPPANNGPPAGSTPTGNTDPPPPPEVPDPTGGNTGDPGGN